MKRTLLVLTASLGLAATPGAWAVMLDFDSLGYPYGGGYVPNGYGGVNWNNLSYYDARTVLGPSIPESGYHLGCVSPNKAVMNAYGTAGTITGVGAGLFQLGSAYITGAWNDNLSIEVVGKLHGSTVFDNTFIVNATVPSLITFDHSAVDIQSHLPRRAA